jgi:hypothetical protein
MGGIGIEFYINENDPEEFLIEYLSINSLNILRNYLDIPEIKSPEAENEEFVTKRVKAYVNSLKDSKKIIEILMERADSYL